MVKSKAYDYIGKVIVVEDLCSTCMMYVKDVISHDYINPSGNYRIHIIIFSGIVIKYNSEDKHLGGKFLYEGEYCAHIRNYNDIKVVLKDAFISMINLKLFAARNKIK